MRKQKKIQSAGLFLGWRLLLLLFFFVTSVSLLLCSGTIESEDGWLYTGVARNIFYKGKPLAQPNEYAARRNVNMNSIQQTNGTWKAPGSLGYSLSLVPAVALSHLYHWANQLPQPQYFPLETDWSLMFFVSLSNAFWAGVLACLLAQYAYLLQFTRKTAVILGLTTVFLTNLTPQIAATFPHLLFTCILLALFLLVKLYSLTQRKILLPLLAVTLAALSQAYNISYLITLPPLFLYWFLLMANRKLPAKVSQLGVVVITALPLILLPVATVIFAHVSLHPKVVFEGIFGLIFSSGKSIFIYTPLLLLLPLFWSKLNNNHPSELKAFAYLILMYLWFYSLSYLDEGKRGLFPIWHGGASWGPRYLVPLVPFGLIVVFWIIEKLNKWQKILIVGPLVALSFLVQILGVAIPYQVQYRGLPYNIFISQHEITIYDYGSFLPRFSPILTQTKELVQKIVRFPQTFSRGKYYVRFYDGFNLPYHQKDGPTLRGFKNEAHISWRPVSPNNVDLVFYNAPDNYGQAQTQFLKISTTGSSQVVTLPPQTEVKVGLHVLDPYLDFKLQSSASQSAQVIYITQMKINGDPVNLGSLDYPYLDLNQASKSRGLASAYWGIVETNPWALWDMRARVFEESLQFWWIRFLYYWDLPHQLLAFVLTIDAEIVLLSGVLLAGQFKRKS